MKRQIYSIFAFVVTWFWSLGTLAQAADTASEESIKAELKQRLAKFQTFSAQFEQTVTDLQGELIQESAGQLILKQPAKLKWDVSKPDETTILADGTSLWHIDPFVEQVTVVDQASAVQSNPIVLLTQQSDTHWAKFLVTQSGNVFTIVPKEENGQIASLTVEFRQDQLASLTIVDKQQQRSLIRFSDVQYNIDVANDAFTFVLPSGFDLDDQR